MTHLYDEQFFDWVRLTGLRSAARVIPVVRNAVRPQSVVDVGCGEGAWLSVWAATGGADVFGLDGAYVKADQLMIDRGCFAAVDLAQPFAAPRRFDLAQSLEVAEHLPPASSRSFVRSLVALSDVVLFSAAQPGQGGENHINERPVSFWAGLFREEGYEVYDCIRPALRYDASVAPWYRFNTVLFASEAGRARLAAATLATRIADHRALDQAGPFAWELRKALLRRLPVTAVSWLSRARYRAACARARWRLTPARG